MMATNIVPFRAPGVHRVHFSGLASDPGHPSRLHAVGDERAEYRDDELPLILRVSPGRRPVRAWVLYYRDGARRQKRMTLGRFPAMGVPQARARAAELLNVVARGGDPLAQRREAARTSASVEELVRQFLDARQRQDGTIAPLAATSLREYGRVLSREVVPALGKKAAHLVVRDDVERLVAGIRKRGVVALADRVAAIVKSVFRWAARKRIIPSNPTADIEVAPTNRRDRIFTDDELRIIWQTPGRHQGLIRLAMLTALRRDEVASARWQDFDFAAREWKVPRVKGGRAHTIWLNEDLLRVLAEIPQSGDWLFPGRAGGYTQHPAVEAVAVPGFRLHDLRHTVRSRLSGLGVTPDSGERVLAHKISGMRGVYDHYDYAPVIGEALARWAVELSRIVGGAL